MPIDQAHYKELIGNILIALETIENLCIKWYEKLFQGEQAKAIARRLPEVGDLSSETVTALIATDADSFVDNAAPVVPRTLKRNNEVASAQFLPRQGSLQSPPFYRPPSLEVRCPNSFVDPTFLSQTQDFGVFHRPVAI